MSYHCTSAQLVSSASRIRTPKTHAVRKNYCKVRSRSARYNYDKRTVEGLIETLSNRRFDNLAVRLLRDTQITSSPSVMAQNENFVAISRMGERATKRILRRMSAGDIRLIWLIALRVITKENPVPQHSVGIVAEMGQHWLAWGKQQHLI